MIDSKRVTVDLIKTDEGYFISYIQKISLDKGDTNSADITVTEIPITEEMYKSLYSQDD